MARRRRYSTDSSDEVKGRNTKRSRPKTPEPNATGRKTFGAETTRRKVPASKTIDAKKSTVPKTTGLKSTEADTKRPDISKSKRNSAAPATSGYSRRQLLALQAPQDGSRDEMNANRSKSIGSVHAGMTNPPHDLEHLFPQAEVLRAMLPGFHFYLEIYEKRTHTEGKHDQDYPNLVRDFQRTMTPLFQKYLSDRAEQLIEEESGLQLVGKEALGPNKQGNTSGFSLKGRVAGGDEVPAVGLEVDRPGAVLSLENQLPQIFAQDTPNNGVENAWIWNSDLLTTSNDTGNFGRLAFFAVSLPTCSAIMKRWRLTE